MEFDEKEKIELECPFSSCSSFVEILEFSCWLSFTIVPHPETERVLWSEQEDGRDGQEWLDVHRNGSPNEFEERKTFHVSLSLRSALFTSKR